MLPSCQPGVPGCWFSVTTGLAANTAAGGRGLAIPTRPSRQRTAMTRRRRAPGRAATRSCSVMSVGSLERQNDPQRPNDQLQIHPEAPVIDVLEIECQRLIEIQGRPAADLPETGQAGFHGETPRDQRVVGGELVRTAWPRSDDAPVTFEDVDQLRELVQAGDPQDVPHARDARVVAHFEEGWQGFVEVFELGLAPFGVWHHAAKLQHPEPLAVHAEPLLDINRVAR